jgi:hypothetical protein
MATFPASSRRSAWVTALLMVASTACSSSDGLAPQTDAGRDTRAASGRDAKGGAGGDATFEGGRDCGRLGEPCCTGESCASTLSCAGGVCDCSEGRTACSGACFDEGTDPNHCGSCATVCPKGQTCESAICCPDGESVCGSKCVDETTDDSNCGGCGLTCNTGCNAGECLVVIADDQTSPAGIALDVANLYWVDTETVGDGSYDYVAPVMQLTQSGGTPVSLASSLDNGSGIALDATHVYWTTIGTAAKSYNDGTVMKAPKGGGGAPVTLATGVPDPWGPIVVAHATVYWADGGGGAGAISSVPSGGGEVRSLVSATIMPIAIAVDATNVYWTDDSAPGVLKVPVSGGTPTTLASGTVPQGIAIDATSVYWADSGAGATFESCAGIGTVTSNGTITKVPLSGGTPTTLASGRLCPFNIVVDGTSVYWSEGMGNGGISLMKVPLGGGAPVTLASSVGSVAGLAVGATSLYFTDPETIISGEGPGPVWALTPK